MMFDDQTLMTLLCVNCRVKVRQKEQELKNDLKLRDENRAQARERYGVKFVKDCEACDDGFLIMRLGIAESNYRPYLGCTVCKYGELFKTAADEAEALRILKEEFERITSRKENK